MGIDVFTLNFLMRNRRETLGNTLCLGRQGIHLQTEDSRVVALALEQKMSIEDLRRFIGIEKNIFAEELFLNLGSSNVESMDISQFEGATIIHDLNEPVGSELVDKFDCIFDGGTIEHVFNFPAAITNVKRMLRLGGIYYFINAANNMLGHGLYQFSPELLWRLFSLDAGFAVIDMRIVETEGNGNFIPAPDPQMMGRRNEISITTGQTYLMMAAVKVSQKTEGGDVYQSDYSKAWSEHNSK